MEQACLLCTTVKTRMCQNRKDVKECIPVGCSGRQAGGVCLRGVWPGGEGVSGGGVCQGVCLRGISARGEGFCPGWYIPACTTGQTPPAPSAVDRIIDRRLWKHCCGWLQEVTHKEKIQTRVFIVSTTIITTRCRECSFVFTRSSLNKLFVFYVWVEDFNDPSPPVMVATYAALSR